jgi:hypothetical protein
MIRILITAEAFAAVEATLPVGSVSLDSSSSLTTTASG